MVFYSNLFPHPRVFKLTKTFLIIPLPNMDNLEIRNSNSAGIEPSYQHKCVILFFRKIILLGKTY